jgi:hypothetical protein
MKKWSIWLTCVLVAVMMIAGLGVIAAEYGSQSDPLVTLSYIEKVLLPNAQKDVDKTVSNAIEEFEDALTDSDKTIQSYIDKKLRSFASGDVDEELIDAIAASVLEQAGGSVTAGEVSWSVIQVPAGSTVVCEVGVQAILRVGQATCVAAGTPGFIDLSNGETLENGGALAANHLYTASIQGRGIYTAQGCTLLIAGSYTIQ